MFIAAFGVHFSIRSFGLELLYIIADWNAEDMYSMGIAFQPPFPILGKTINRNNSFLSNFGMVY